MADLQEQIKKTQERTKRLIERGAILENAIGNATLGTWRNAGAKSKCIPAAPAKGLIENFSLGKTRSFRLSL